MNELNVCIYEQPGKLCSRKAQALARVLQAFYLCAPEEVRAEIDRRAAELRMERKEQTHDK